MEILIKILFWCFLIGGGLFVAFYTMITIYKLLSPILSWWWNKFLPALMAIFIISAIGIFLFSLFYK